ncbi:MAG: Rrf2 family transcriptional regulator [Bacillota bacterium]
MKFSTKARYGLRAMVELALNYDSGEPLSLSQVAQKQAISEGYLEQLMTYLRKDGLVKSVRGAQGGYMLARKPSNITAGEVIRCLEGPLSLIDCAQEGEKVTCSRADGCAARLFWERVRGAVADVLDSSTLEDLAEESENLCQGNKAYMYYI